MRVNHYVYNLLNACRDEDPRIGDILKIRAPYFKVTPVFYSH